MILSSVIDQIKENCPSFSSRVEVFNPPAHSSQKQTSIADVLKNYPIPHTPFCLVSRDGSFSEKSETAPFSQYITERYLIIVVANNAGSNSNNTTLELESLMKNEIDVALLGWKYDELHEPMNHVEDLDVYKDGVTANFSMWEVSHYRYRV